MPRKAKKVKAKKPVVMTRKNAAKKMFAKKPAKKAVKRAGRKKAVAKRAVAKRALTKKTTPKKAVTAKAPKMTGAKLNEFVQAKVEKFIQKLFKNNYEHQEDGRFLVYEGSTVVQTVIRPWHESDVIVETFAYVVQEANLDENILKFLLRENAMLHFGAFGITFDGTIIFSNSLAGANLDENEFMASIKSVARIADFYDNKIVEMAGGMTARDAMKKGII